MEISQNGGTPKSSILMRFLNEPSSDWGTPILPNTGIEKGYPASPTRNWIQPFLSRNQEVAFGRCDACGPLKDGSKWGRDRCCASSRAKPTDMKRKQTFHSSNPGCFLPDLGGKPVCFHCFLLFQNFPLETPGISAEGLS